MLGVGRVIDGIYPWWIVAVQFGLVFLVTGAVAVVEVRLRELGSVRQAIGLTVPVVILLVGTLPSLTDPLNTFYPYSAPFAKPFLLLVPSVATPYAYFLGRHRGDWYRWILPCGAFVLALVTPLVIQSHAEPILTYLVEGPRGLLYLRGPIETVIVAGAVAFWTGLPLYALGRMISGDPVFAPGQRRTVLAGLALTVVLIVVGIATGGIRPNFLTVLIGTGIAFLAVLVLEATRLGWRGIRSVTV